MAYSHRPRVAKAETCTSCPAKRHLGGIGVDRVASMSSWWWAAVLLVGAVCAAIGLTLGSTEHHKHNAAAAVVLLSAVAILTAGILGLAL